jgi:hypothetical protein
MPVFAGCGHLCEQLARETALSIFRLRWTAALPVACRAERVIPSGGDLARKPSLLSRKMSVSFRFLMLQLMRKVRHHHRKPPF